MHSRWQRRVREESLLPWTRSPVPRACSLGSRVIWTAKRPSRRLRESISRRRGRRMWMLEECWAKGVGRPTRLIRRDTRMLARSTGII